MRGQKERAEGRGGTGGPNRSEGGQNERGDIHDYPKERKKKGTDLTFRATKTKNISISIRGERGKRRKTSARQSSKRLGEGKRGKKGYVSS